LFRKSYPILPLLRIILCMVCISSIALSASATNFYYPNSDPPIAIMGLGLRTDGLYAFREGDNVHYLRFFPDRYVLSARAKTGPAEIAHWRIPLSQYYSSSYTTQGIDTIRFSMYNPAGIVDYVGIIRNDGILLDSYTRVNNQEVKQSSQDYSFLYIDPRYAMVSNAVSHKFGYGGPEENLGITLINFQYGELQKIYLSNPPGRVVPNFKAFVDMPIPQGLYVKWRDNHTGAVYEDIADLKPILSSDITGLTVHFKIVGGQLNVYLISRTLHAPSESDCPIEQYRYYKCGIVYSGKQASLLEPGKLPLQHIPYLREMRSPPPPPQRYAPPQQMPEDYETSQPAKQPAE
jgi:hypothetical protein